ncbi:XRE family transcriptional regulator [[Clostridium] aminophilum]|uniref:XRE family transcriptional regulator n=1 Tax=[Clostridium] aminophilum TaxID=1526 RepID=UPI00331F94E1
MGRKSIKENKSYYQLVREEKNITRAYVENKSNSTLSASRLEKLENETLEAHPEDIMIMADIYDSPELCNYYCTKKCPIGKMYVPSVDTIHDLPQITVELLSKLNALNREKDRMIDIAADGAIGDDEIEDFNLFCQHLEDMKLAIETLRLWADKTNRKKKPE